VDIGQFISSAESLTQSQLAEGAFGRNTTVRSEVSVTVLCKQCAIKKDFSRSATKQHKSFICNGLLPQVSTAKFGITDGIVTDDRH
jgi:hypothetical protein